MLRLWCTCRPVYNLNRHYVTKEGKYKNLSDQEREQESDALLAKLQTQQGLFLLNFVHSETRQDVISDIQPDFRPSNTTKFSPLAPCTNELPTPAAHRDTQLYNFIEIHVHEQGHALVSPVS